MVPKTTLRKKSAPMKTASEIKSRRFSPCTSQLSVEKSCFMFDLHVRVCVSRLLKQEKANHPSVNIYSSSHNSFMTQGTGLQTHKDDTLQEVQQSLLMYSSLLSFPYNYSPVLKGLRELPLVCSVQRGSCKWTAVSVCADVSIVDCRSVLSVRKHRKLCRPLKTSVRD